MKFCQQPLKNQGASSSNDHLISSYSDDTFVLEYNSTIGIFWKYNVLNCNVDSLNNVFKIVSLTILML